ncbi:hypothetical protein FRC09_020279 [Ceratobasidium sp. 395]|nr:hypothetical protein FRC09_020279 [Ceratobasidium sp. 395]
MAPTAKRARKELSTSRQSQSSDEDSSSSPKEAVVDNAGTESSEEENESTGNDSSSTDTETEITRAQSAKSKKTSKRKRRATSPTPFGQTLESLLATSVPGGTQAGMPLALKPSLSRRKNEEKLEIKAKRVLEVERKEREDKGHVRDVIEGWNNEDERSLRKVAQRGVVHLFNAIQQAQSASAASAEDAKKLRGTGKPTLPAPKPHEIGKNLGKSKKVEPAGKTKDASANLDKSSFLNMIRAGGVVRQA